MSSTEFKKIRSVLARKEVWQEAASLVDHLCVIKMGSDSAFPSSIVKATSEGVWLRFDDSKADRELFMMLHQQFTHEILGYLILREHRYYFVGRLSNQGDFRVFSEASEIFIPYQFEMFKLDRRSNFRVKLPESERFTAGVTEYQGKLIEVTGIVKDVSGGGFRLALREDPIFLNFEIGAKIKGEINPTKEKSILFEAMVRHFKKEGGLIECGVMILEDQIKSSYRLMALTLTLQRKLINLNY